MKIPKIKPQLAQYCTWILLLLQACLISISWYLHWYAGKLFDYKTGSSGDFQAAEAYNSISAIFFAMWLSTIIIAIILGVFFEAKNRETLYLFALALMPLVEIIILFIAGLFSY
ncbi:MULTISPECIES: hypothetical protein [Deefgea]|uniref:Uncharacterized protein n=1 Tax=Deefgea chitinilytica TaxID=570276 RepID=A0ABS2CBE2_9NEIS|nr:MULTISPECIES: hypothetical protein [Deefgea]MBM5571471.1 hypothetical protein [Deefgea chitinilytica]MBM9888704.1 hypothetical protein [Deefgea sp. CFH1-16]